MISITTNSLTMKHNHNEWLSTSVFLYFFQKNRTGDYSSGSSRYSSRYSSSSVSDTTSGYSSGRVSSNYLNDYQPISSRYSSTSIGRSLISRTPAYDKYGKELSNYDRWRLNHGESVVHDTSTTNNNNNNNNLTSSSSYGGYLSKQTADYSCNNNDTTTTIKPRSSRRISRYTYIHNSIFFFFAFALNNDLDHII